MVILSTYFIMLALYELNFVNSTKMTIFCTLNNSDIEVGQVKSPKIMIQFPLLLLSAWCRFNFRINLLPAGLFFMMQQCRYNDKQPR